MDTSRLEETPTPSATTPGIAVVVATRNRASRLRTLLQSVAQLERGQLSFELIIADNGSSDHTREVVEAFAAQVPFAVRYVLEPRRGVSHARNSGAAASTRELIAFADDDQTVATDWLLAIDRAFSDHADVDVVVGRVLPRWSTARPAWITKELQGAAGIIDRGPQAFRITRSRWMCLPGGNMAWRREAFVALGGFSPDWPRSEDREISVRFLLSGRTALYAPDVVVHHHLDDSRLTKPFFRAWYLTEGYMRAGFAGEELFSRDGLLRPVPDDVPKLLGVSRFVYRQWLREVGAYVKARIAMDRTRAFVHESRALLLSAYLRRRIELQATPGAPITRRAGARLVRAFGSPLPAPDLVPPASIS